MTLLVDLDDLLAFTLAIANLPWKINIPCGKQTIIYVVVYRLLIEHDHVCIVAADVMD